MRLSACILGHKALQSAGFWGLRTLGGFWDKQSVLAPRSATLFQAQGNWVLDIRHPNSKKVRRSVLDSFLFAAGGGGGPWGVEVGTVRIIKGEHPKF